ncbi:MAG: Eco57I restriction-modification methylase domain-containing protein [Nitrososphaeraceae archaeon]
MNNSLLEYTDHLRNKVDLQTNAKTKHYFEQFFSSISIARLMASMFQYPNDHIKILDAGAGTGSLFAACIDEIMKKKHVTKISLTTYEIDPILNKYIYNVIKLCKEKCKNIGVKFESEQLEKDFIDDSASKLGLSLSKKKYFNCVILNPPYKKININTNNYRILKNLGIPTTNFYSAFILLATKFIENNGELVSITPRSFCNGTYFKQFRKQFLDNMNINRIHLFNSRGLSFKKYKVLQENVIFHSTKNKTFNSVIISTSESSDDKIIMRKVDSNKIIRYNDPEKFIYIITDKIGDKISNNLSKLRTNISGINLNISTGKVVDFRNKQFLNYKSSNKTVPLIYPINLNGNGFVKWPIDKSNKPKFIRLTPETKSMLVEGGNYVLVKRFSSKEQKKRIVAAIYENDKYDFHYIGFENKVNYFHQNGKGLDLTIAKGLTMFLNTTIIDSFFRQFSGHTQVNATDLRSIPYPTLDQLKRLGMHISDNFPDQELLDTIVQNELFS